MASDVTSSVVTMFAYCEFEVLAVHDEQVYAGNDEGGVRVFEITVAHPGPNELPILVEIAFQAPNSDFASDTADGWLDLSSLPPRVLSRAEYLAFLADGSNPDLPHDEFQAVLAQFADGEDTPVVIAGAHYAHGEAQGSAETDDAGEQP